MSQKLDKNNVEAVLTLTPLQEGMLFHYLEAPDSLQYFEQLLITMEGEVNETLIEQAWKYVGASNEMLRAIFRWDRLEKPAVIILKEKAIPLEVIDLSRCESEAVAMQTIKDEDMDKGIDLSENPLRMKLCKLSEKRFVLMITNHHILYDGWSNGVLIKEFIESYNALMEAEAPTILPKNKFGVFLEWCKKQDQKKIKDYWSQYLDGFKNPTEFPVRYVIDSKGSVDKPHKQTCTLENELYEQVNSFTRDNKITVASLMYTAWGILLSKYTNQKDVVFGTTVSGRNAKINGIENMAGLFINTLPTRIKSENGQAVIDQLKNVNGELAQREAFESAMLSEIAVNSEIPAGAELFRSIVVIENYPIEKELESLSKYISITQIETFEMTNYDLTVAVECFDGLGISLLYNPKVLSETTVDTLLRHLVNIVKGIIKNPNAAIDKIELLDAHDIQLLHDFNPQHTDYGREKTLQQLFEEQVNNCGDAVAITHNGTSMTYEALNEKVNRLAHYLKKNGVGNNTLVALIFERSIELVVTMLAVLKAGGAYVPIDPEYPDTRIQDILEDSKPVMLLTNCVVDDVVVGNERATYRWCELEAEIEKESSLNPTELHASDSLAYVMYTSGSTGKPKGNLISQYSISRVVINTNYIAINKEDVLLQLSNYSFDGSTFDVFGALLNGAKLVMIDKEKLLNLYDLGELIVGERITIFFITTSLFNSLVDENIECMAHVKYVLTGGERASFRHMKKFFDAYGEGKLIHAYGPTESTVFATCHVVSQLDEASKVIPIGGPIANTSIYIVNQSSQLAPIGGVGEICIAGDGLAKGYLHNEVLTKEKFTNNPFEEDPRCGVLYHTGDLGKWREDGTIEYVDRMDNQVKLRGFRIELGEIEKALTSIEGVSQTIVRVLGDESSDRFICAYVTGSMQDIKSIKDELKKSLPIYMIPRSIVWIEKFPLNKNGKVDFNVLPMPEMHRQEELYVAPQNEIESKLQSIWQTVLGIASIGVTENFYEVGGHSLKATLIVSKIHKELDVKIPLGKFLELMTIRENAEYINGLSKITYKAIEAAKIMEYYPLAASQRAVFLQEQFEGVGTSYHVPIALQMSGKLDENRVNQALKALVDDLEILRTSFELKDEPVQIVHPSALLLAEHKVCNQENIDQEIAMFIGTFDLAKPPLMRVMLLDVAEEEQMLVIDIHHILSDGIAIKVLLEKFFALYKGEDVEATPLHYKDYAVWQQTQMTSEAMIQQKQFWHQTFADQVPVVDFPSDYSRKGGHGFEGGNKQFVIEAELVKSLENMGKRLNVSMNSLFFAGYAILLRKYCGESDFVIGSLVEGRTNPDVERMVGMFNNYLPIRVSIDEHAQLEETMQSVAALLSNCYDNQDYPYDLLAEDFKARRSLSRNPFFDTMMIYHNELDEVVLPEIEGIKVDLYNIKNNTAKLDFKLDLYHEKDTIRCVWEYSKGLYTGTSIERMATHYIKLLEGIVENSEKTIESYSVLTIEEERRILETFNDTEVSYSSHQTLDSIFEAQVSKTPDAIAIGFTDKVLTFSEINSKANSLARVLRKAGVKADSIVGVMTERSAAMMIGILAVLKAGGAYMPIGTTYPVDRITYMLEDSKAVALLTQDQFMTKVVYDKVINLDHPAVYRDDDSNLEQESRTNSLAYVIYTSGSTGKPKGVMIEHTSAVNRIEWMQKKYPIGQGDKILQKTPYTFDVSVWELFWWMFTGSSVYFLKPEGEKDPATILAAIEKEGITTMHFVPSMLALFLEYYEMHQGEYDLSSLKRVFASGEALTIGQVEKFNTFLYETNQTTLHNLYGPTEATVDVSYYDCPVTGEITGVPIGKPIDNTRLYVLDKQQRLQPVGVAGELYISGVGVARGYLNREELTAEKFMKDPYFDGYTMYRSGDLTKWLDNGDVEYLGRIDNQVKIRGLRIELGEIEARLAEHEAINESAVTVREDASGSKYLCGYYTGKEALSVELLRKHITEKLPDYMVPSYFIKLDQMPLSANGKLDRKLLPEPEGRVVTEIDYKAPENEIQEKLASLWESLLVTDQVGIHDNFFDLGGHSLKAARLVSEIRSAFGVEMTLNQVFENPTVKEQEDYICSATKCDYKAISKAPEQEYYALSAAQERLYILHRMDEGVTYNLSSVLKINGSLDRSRFEDVLKEMMRRHGQLRASFHMIDGKPVQKIHEERKAVLEQINCNEGEVHEKIHQFIRPFDFENEPLIRFLLIHSSEETYYFVFDMHHIISDGVSSVLLAKEFMTLYGGGVPITSRVAYQDYVLWQEEQASQTLVNEPFWMKELEGDLTPLDVPTDFTRPAIQEYTGAKKAFKIGTEITEKIKQTAYEKGVTPYMICVAAYNILLHKYTGQEDIIIGTPVAGRSRLEFEDIVGMFVNTLVLRNYPCVDKTGSDFIEEVKENTLRAFEHQDYQFEALVQRLGVTRDLSRNPLFDTMLVYQNMGISAMDLEGVTFENYPLESKVSKFDLTIELVEDGEAIQLNIEYATSLYVESTIDRLASHYIKLLEEITTDSHKTIESYSVLTSQEESLILETFNATEAPYHMEQTLDGVFEEQAIQTPNAIAIGFGNQTLTFSELNSRANSLAQVLRNVGVQADSIVGVMAERSIEMMVGVLAVVKAGGAYMPISPDYPVDRIHYMLEDSQAVAVLTQERFIEKIVYKQLINLDEPSLYNEKVEWLERVSKPHSLAYVIYTSGSTGKPKGVMIEHTSAVNRIEWMQKKYPIGQCDKILQKTPFTFDVSVWELFWWMFTGAGVHFLRPEGEKDPSALLEAIEKEHITTMHFVPSMLAIFLEYYEMHQEEYDLSSLKRVFASGEALTIGQVEKFNTLLYSKYQTTLHNLYGPTEATVDVSYYDCEVSGEVKRVPIGKPIDNTRLYVLDKCQRLQPVGVAGELYISGVGVARGYLNREDLTTEKFMKDPYYEGYTMYRSGDLTRWLENGDVEYLGRIDNQVKIRGLRIELGEIEARLSEHQVIHESVVTVREDSNGSKYLCGCYTGEEELSIEILRKHITEKLPDYMVPSYFIKLDKMPLSANGKLDRKALPKPEGRVITEIEYRAPENNTQQKLVEIWQTLLNTEQVGIYDNFFDLGGHSLLLVKMHGEIDSLYPGVLRVTDLFQYTNIAELASYIDCAGGRCVQAHELVAMVLPEAYHAGGDGVEMSDVMELAIDLGLKQKVLDKATELQVEYEDIMIAIYIYLLSKLTKDTKPSVEVCAGEKMLTLMVDMEQQTDFRAFIKGVAEQRITKCNVYAYEDAKKSGDEGTFTFAYIDGFVKCPDIDWIQKYDVVIRSEGNRDLDFFYNTRRLDDGLMKDFVGTYLKLIIVILEQLK